MSDQIVEFNGEVQLDETIKITDLNLNALEKIFDCLSLNDLLNIADTSKKFKQPADWVFRSKYGKRKIIFWRTNPSRCNHPVWPTDNIYIDNFSLCFKILRSFGHAISKLDVNYLKINGNKCAKIDYYVVKYCTALAEISFKHAGVNTLNCIVKPFEKIEKLIFEDSYVGGKLANLNKWFPRLRALELKFYMRIENSKCLEKHFQHLESLTIDGQVSDIRGSNLINTLCFNPQLRQLSISDKFDMKFLQYASKHLHFLEKLEIRKWTEQEFAHSGEFIHLKNVQIVTIDFSRCYKVPEIPLRFDQLETLIVDAMYMCRLNDNFIDFMQKHTTIRKLKIFWQNYGFQRKITNCCNAIFKEKLAQASAYLWEFEIDDCIFSSYEAISFLKQCKYLKQFCLPLQNQNEYDALNEHLGKEWRKFVDDQNCIRFERTSSIQYK